MGSGIAAMSPGGGSGGCAGGGRIGDVEQPAMKTSRRRVGLTADLQPHAQRKLASCIAHEIHDCLAEIVYGHCVHRAAVVAREHVEVGEADAINRAVLALRD